MTLDLGDGVTFHADHESRIVVTYYTDGYQCAATRPDTLDNRAEAEDQGYTSPDALWDSLVHHELLHTLIARRIFRRESLVLRHESGAEKHRYALRLHEEALAISFQNWLHTDDPDPVLWPYTYCLRSLRNHLERLLACATASAERLR